MQGTYKMKWTHKSPHWGIQEANSSWNKWRCSFDGFSCSSILPHCFTHIWHLFSWVSDFGKEKNSTPPSKLSGYSFWICRSCRHTPLAYWFRIQEIQVKNLKQVQLEKDTQAHACLLHTLWSQSVVSSNSILNLFLKKKKSLLDKCLLINPNIKKWN